MNHQHGIEAVIFDWSGTTVDFGSVAPTAAMQEAFNRVGVELSAGEVRAFLGIHKRDHVAKLFATERVAEHWKSQNGRPANDEDIDRVYDEFVSALRTIVPAHSAPIDGVPELVGRLRASGIRVGSSTGFTAEMMDAVREGAAAGGYEPETIVTSSEVAAGRPAPFMLFRNAELLRVADLDAIVKVGDTPADMRAGRAARVWTVGVAIGGNELSAFEEPQSLPTEDVNLTARQLQSVRRVRSILFAAGADLVVDRIAYLDDALEVIGQWRRDGRRPA